MQEEMDAISENDTWRLVPLPPNRKPLPTLWVFKIKRDVDGNIARYKARLVVEGSRQKPGIDFNKTYAPVVNFPTLRLLFALTAQLDWECHHLDVKNAFLKGKLEEEVFVKQPPGFVNAQHPNHVYQLLRSLYGLRQSPRCWFLEIDQSLVSIGFIPAQSQPGIYIFLLQNRILIIALYVDDILLFASDSEILSEYKVKLMQKYQMTDLGPVKHILNIEVIRDRTNRKILLRQTHYINSLLKSHDLTDCNPVSTPIEPSTILTAVTSPENAENFPYRQVVGSLMYLMIATRPDLAYVVGKLSQFNSCNGPEHWAVVKRVLRYIRGTKNQGLLIQPSSTDLSCYSDADFAGSIDDRKSTSGVLALLGSSCIHWVSRKQATVATSTAEAEYQALALAASESLWMRQLLQELCILQTAPSPIYCDNRAAIAISQDPYSHKRAKHIDVKFHFIRDCIKSRKLQVLPVPTVSQLADFLTKPLAAPRLQKLLLNLMSSE